MRTLLLALIALAVAAGLLLAPSVLAVRSGTERAYNDFRYPYPDAPDCNERNSRSCARDLWGLLQGQCTSWVAFRVNGLNGVPIGMHYAGIRWGDARNWNWVAEKVGIPVDRIARRGAVAYYADNHVAYVEEVKSATEIVISEMNYDGHNGFRFRTVHMGYDGWPDAFIHFGNRGSAWAAAVAQGPDREV